MSWVPVVRTTENSEGVRTSRDSSSSSSRATTNSSLPFLELERESMMGGTSPELLPLQAWILSIFFFNGKSSIKMKLNFGMEETVSRYFITTSP